MTVSRTPKRLQHVRFICLIVFGCLACVLDARVLTPYEQAVGHWDVTLKPNGWKKNTIPSLLFPPLKQSVLDGNDSSRETLLSPTTMHCQLSIFSNGTFCMNAPSSPDPTDENRLPLRGKWKLKGNPYCITDRHYDQLVLESFPRVQKRASDNQILQKVGMRLDCRVWGRYGSGPIRKFMGYETGRKMGRMTHGTLLWNVDESLEEGNNKDKPWKSRRVCASFTAKPLDTSVLEEDDDNDIDYDEDDF